MRTMVQVQASIKNRELCFFPKKASVGQNGFRSQPWEKFWANFTSLKLLASSVLSSGSWQCPVPICDAPWWSSNGHMMHRAWPCHLAEPKSRQFLHGQCCLYSACESVRSSQKGTALQMASKPKVGPRLLWPALQRWCAFVVDLSDVMLEEYGCVVFSMSSHGGNIQVTEIGRWWCQWLECTGDRCCCAGSTRSGTSATHAGINGTNDLLFSSRFDGSRLGTKLDGSC